MLTTKICIICWWSWRLQHPCVGSKVSVLAIVCITPSVDIAGVIQWCCKLKACSKVKLHHHAASSWLTVKTTNPKLVRRLNRWCACHGTRHWFSWGLRHQQSCGAGSQKGCCHSLRWWTYGKVFCPIHNGTSSCWALMPWCTRWCWCPATLGRPVWERGSGSRVNFSCR